MCPGTLWFSSLWAGKPCAAWSAPAFLWAFCPAVQSVKDGDIYNHYKATVLAACHSGAHVQVATIWQDICSATGRALDAATCPQRRHCTLPFGGGYIAFPPMQEMNSESNTEDALSIVSVILHGLQVGNPDTMFRMYLIRTWWEKLDWAGSHSGYITLPCNLGTGYLTCQWLALIPSVNVSYFCL